MRRPARGVLALLAALGMAVGMGVQAVSASVLWTMTASPSTAVVGVNTTFTFTATNLDPVLGVKCVIVDVPSEIALGEVWISGSSTAAAWTASRSGQQITAVIDQGDGDEKLQVGDWLSFAAAAVPSHPGTYALPGVAYSGHDCFTGARALAAPPLFVVSEAVVTEPIPTPAPDPTTTPAPILTLPSITALPSLPLAPVAAPPRATKPPTELVALSQEAPAAAPAATVTPSVAGVPADPPRTGIRAPAAPSGASNRPVLALARPEAAGQESADVSLGPLGVIDGLSVWAVPGAVIGGPGILVILWVALQTGVAAAWIPAVQRMRGDGRRARPWRGVGH